MICASFLFEKNVKYWKKTWTRETQCGNNFTSANAEVSWHQEYMTHMISASFLIGK